MLNHSKGLSKCEAPDISLVVPVHNEEEVLEVFLNEVKLNLISVNYEVIFVDDGSYDNTLKLIKSIAAETPYVKAVSLSRNFGKEVALTAGIEYSTGRTVIPMDCDLQDPIELVMQMYQKWLDGHLVVLAKRIDRTSDSVFKRTTSSLFYKIINFVSDVKIPENVGDYRLMDRKVVNALNAYPERLRFMKGIFATLGFKYTTIEYTRPKRAAGKTSWNYFKLYSLAIEGIVSFTSFPLKVWSYIGVSVAMFSFLYGAYLLIRTMLYGVDLPGYASIMVVLLFMSGLILTCLGFIGEYLSRIFIEVKQRPVYIVMETVGFDD